MMRNYILSSYRNIIKNKLNFVISVIGTSVSLFCCIFIFSYVRYECSYDASYPNANQIYRVSLNKFKEGSLESENAMAFAALGPAMKTEFPEVKDFCRFRPFIRGINKEAVLKTNDNNIFLSQNVYYADSSVFSMFDLQLLSTNPESHLKRTQTVIISNDFAQKYFNSENPVGKVISINGWHGFEITGVFKKLPENSHFNFDVLVSFITLEKHGRNYESRKWENPAYTYILLEPNADSKDLEKKLSGLIQANKPWLTKKEENETLFLQPIKSIHLHSKLLDEIGKNGDILIIRFFIILAILILAISWINNINLSTAMVIDRGKEVSIRKIIGAGKKHLIVQHIVEGLLISLISVSLTVGLIVLSKNWIGNILNIRIITAISRNIEFVFLIILAFIFLSFLVNIYPSALLSSFRPSGVLNISYSKLNRNGLRKILVVFQFSVSIILIIGSLVISKQFNFIKKENPGLDIENTIVIRRFDENDRNQNNAVRLEAFKEELRKNPKIRSITSSTQIPGQEIMVSMPVNRLANKLKSSPEIYMIGVDYDFLKKYDIPITEGRGFSRDLDRNTFGAALLNKAAVNALKYNDVKSCINDSIDAGGIQTKIVGVFENFYQLGYKSEVPPIIFSLAPDVGYLSVKYQASDHNEVRNFIQDEYRKFYPLVPFDFIYLKDFYYSQYDSDFQFGSIFYAFMIISIVIACMSLFGLSTYCINKKVKEIGIRKVNGARISEILIMLNRDFVKWIAMSFVIAAPIAYYAMNKWLQNFAYKTTLSWWIFVLAGAMALGIALFTVSWQSWRAARRNPVEALRYE